MTEAEQCVTAADPLDRSPALSVVVPVFANASTLPELTDRLLAALGSSSPHVEVLFVDDASPDDSWAVITRLAAGDPHVRGIRLAANVGALTAIAAGCSFASGDIVCSIDADLENRPEDLPALVAAVAGGLDLVSAVRVDQEGRSWVRRVATLLTRLAVARAWSFRPRDFGCGMKAWRAHLGTEANRSLATDRDVAWAVRLFALATSYGEVEVAWDDQRRRSSFTAMRKLRQGVGLIAAVHRSQRRRSRRAAGALGPPFCVAERCP